MSENEGGESKSVGAFLLGFLTGVLVCVGIGFGLFVVVGRTSMMRAEVQAARAAEAEAVARMEADRARAAEMHAREERAKAEQALREAKKQKEKEKEKGKETDKDKEKEKKDR